MVTGLYSLLHFLVDLACAHGMYRYFVTGADGYWQVLMYNFCAFALQMPLGALLDGQKRNAPGLWAGAGLLITGLGMYLHPALLGLGNALFHVGGGVDVIREDSQKDWKGRALGVFVAPGALGLFLGGQLAGVELRFWIAVALIVGAVSLCCRGTSPELPEARKAHGRLLVTVCCFLVVVLRSYVGLSVGFAWKTGFLPGLLAVCAVVLGKAAGGFAAARFGLKATAVVSLGLAAGCYLLSDHLVFGIAALFFFNMSMPITLYRLWLEDVTMPGFAFGLLTFGLFLGFLPVYAGWSVPVSGGVVGALGSLISLGLLTPVWKEDGEWISI